MEIDATSFLITESNINLTASVRPVCYFVQFNISDLACVKQQANLGVIKNVYIKEIQVPESANFVGVLYVDILNMVWNDYELISAEEAQQLATSYLNSRIAAFN
jgi:hypothetical protein